MAFTDNTTGGRVIQAMSLPIKIVLTDTCEVGDLIGFDAVDSDKWERADADAKVYANFVAGEPCNTSGDTITVYREAIVTGFTGAVAGDLLYLDDDPGDYVAAPVGNYHQVVGRFVNTTDALITPGGLPLTAHSVQTSPTGLTEAGFFRTEITAGDSASMCGGIKVECKITSSAGTVASLRGIYVYMQAGEDTTAGGDLCAMRLEDGGSTAINAYIQFVGTSGAGPTNLFDLVGGDSTTAWTADATFPTTNGGHIKIMTTDGARYIGLYKAATGG